jgi:branched-chain amino acid transport system permease protein
MAAVGTVAGRPVVRPRPVSGAASRTWAVGAALAGGLILVPLTFSETTVYRVGVILIFAVAVLGLHVLVNWTGQLSLAHAEVVGLPAFVVAKLSADHGISPIALLPLALAAGAVLGAVVSIPALRVSGLYVAVVTLAVGFGIDRFFFTRTWVIGTGNLEVATPRLGPWTFPTSHSLYPVTAILFVAVVVGVRALYGSKMARSFWWLKVNEDAATAAGINTGVYKILAYVVAGGLAGLSGGMTAMWVQRVTPQSFPTSLSFTYLLVAVLAGPGSAAGVLFVTLLLKSGSSSSAGSSGPVADYLGPVALVVVLARYPSGFNGIGRKIMARVRPVRSSEAHDVERRRTTSAWATAGWGLIVIGLGAIALAWYHTGDTSQVWVQIQDAVSGGLGGIALVVLGVGLLIKDQLASNGRAALEQLQRIAGTAPAATNEDEENVVTIRRGARG